MNPEMEKPRVTEIKVRMDCNGCVQKIKKALHGVTGIHDLHVDSRQQKLTVIGWADPQKIVKAIKKTRKSAVICSHTEQSDQQAQQTSERVPEGGTPEGEAPPPESTEQPQTEAAPPAEAQNEPPPPASQDTPPPPPPDNPPPSPTPPDDPPPESANNTKNQSTQPSKPKDVEETHVIYHHPPDYGHRYDYGHYFQQGSDGQWQPYPSGPGLGGETSQAPRPIYVTHSYNTYKPSPYVTEYAYPQSPPGYSYYNRLYNYNQVYYNGNNGSGNGNITSMFSEENPNACTIV